MSGLTRVCEEEDGRLLAIIGEDGLSLKPREESGEYGLPGEWANPSARGWQGRSSTMLTHMEWMARRKEVLS
jgi:hypothetical protein